MVVSNPGSSEAKVLTTTPSCCPYSDIFEQKYIQNKSNPLKVYDLQTVLPNYL